MKQQLKQAIKNFQTLQNPQEAILSNPNVKQAIDLIKAAGNPQAAFMQLAKQNGLTLEDIKDIFS